MDILENTYRKRLNEPAGPVLGQLKFILRIWQSQGHSRPALSFLLMLESILEKGDPEESIRMKLLPFLQDRTEEADTEKGVSEHEAKFDITVGASKGIYTLHTHTSQNPIEIGAESLLDIATWVEQHRDQLRKDAGQELLDYCVKLYVSRVRPLGSTVPELSIEALNAQEAVGRALLNYGAQEMKVVVVTSSIKEESFSDVKLHADQSITFAQHEERWQPQPPYDTQKGDPGGSLY